MVQILYGLILLKKDAAPKETEQQKLQKTNVWDYANAMQAGAYMG